MQSLFFFIQTRKVLHRGSAIVVLPNIKTLNIQLTIRKYVQQQANETIIGKLNLFYCMTTNLNKRFIFSLIRRPLAPGYEADLLYTQCSLMPGSLSKTAVFQRSGLGMRLYSMLQTLIKIIMYLSVVFYSTQCITTIYVELIFRPW